MSAPPRAPPTIRAIYPELLRRHAHNALSTYEAEQLKAFKVFDHSTKERRYAKPKELAIWLGLDTETANKLKEFNPCDNLVHPKTDFPHSLALKENHSNISEFETCGKTVLCEPSSTTASVLGNAWHKIAAQRMIEALLRTTLKT